MASLDVKRPAAQEQLAVLGPTGRRRHAADRRRADPVEIARRAESVARLQGYDVVLLDTAGRTHIDEPLMAEMAEIRDAARPHEILLVADALTGQDAVNLAKNFNERVGVTGIVLTRVDGDGRGGAALSMRAVTGKPIKLLGVGEKMDALEDFHPRRLADRILGMGDIVCLVEKAARDDRHGEGGQDGRADAQGRLRPRRSLRAARADGEDRRHGRHHGHAAGHGQDQGADRGRPSRQQGDQPPARDHLLDDRRRSDPQSCRRCCKASRKKRIAAGSGVNVEAVNRLLKQHRQMADMMKAMGGKGGKRGA